MDKKVFVLSIFLLFGLLAFCQKPAMVKNYYPGGQLMEKGKQSDIGKTGMWVYYSEKGLLERKENWRKGLRQWTIIYNEKSQKVKMIKADGTEIIYKGCNCKL